MKQSFLRYLLAIVSLISTLGYRASAQQIQATAALDRQNIKIGEQTQLHLFIHQPAKAKVDFPKVVDSVTAKVQVLSASKRDTIKDRVDKDMITVRQNYTISSFDEGTYNIPPFAFGSPSGVIISNQLILTVQTVKVDTTKAIYDIKQPLAVSYTWWDWVRDHWLYIVIPLAVILLIIGIIWYIRTRPKKVVVVKEVIPDVPIHEQALIKLNDLRTKKLYQQNEFKLYHSELTDIIRDYLEQRYIIKTHEKTSDEIFASLKHLDIDQESRNRLKQILLLADLVKFAKEKPMPAENEQSMDNAIAFVQATRQQVSTPKPIEGGTQ